MVNGSLNRVIISAVSKNRIIGNQNVIPWNSKEELKHFKDTTEGYPILMGRKTFESIGEILPNRLNIVISKSSHDSTKQNLLVFNSIKDAYAYLRINGYEKVYICGGARIYRNVIKHAEEMIISHFNFNATGDVKFPNINNKIWRIVNVDNRKDFSIKKYIRIIN